MKHLEIIIALYKHRALIDKAYSGETILHVPQELVKELPIFHYVAKKFELNIVYSDFINAMLGRVDASYRFGDYSEEIKYLNELLSSYNESKNQIYLDRIKKTAKDLYKKMEHQDMLIAARFVELLNNNDLSIEVLIKDANDACEQLQELKGAYSNVLKIFTHRLRGHDVGLDELCVNITYSLNPLLENIIIYYNKLDEFILRSKKTKRENRLLMAVSNSIIKNQDRDLVSLLLSKHELYLHAFKKQNIKYNPSIFEIGRFGKLLKSVIEAKSEEKNKNKVYKKAEQVVVKAINIKIIKEDLRKDRPKNIYKYLQNHPQILKFDEGRDVYAFKVFLSVVQDEHVKIEGKFENGIRVVQWI